MKLTVAAVLTKLISEQMTKAEMARSLGISAVYLGDMLAGKRDLSPKHLDGICKVLDVDAKKCKEFHRMAARQAGWRV